jgi:hypothetical protein
VNREIKDLIQELTARGWEIWKGRKHYKARFGSGTRILVFSATPSCPFAVKKIFRMAEKIENDGND